MPGCDLCGKDIGFFGVKGLEATKEKKSSERDVLFAVRVRYNHGHRVVCRSCGELLDRTETPDFHEETCSGSTWACFALIYVPIVVIFIIGMIAIGRAGRRSFVVRDSSKLNALRRLCARRRHTVRLVFIVRRHHDNDSSWPLHGLSVHDCRARHRQRHWMVSGANTHRFAPSNSHRPASWGCFCLASLAAVQCL